MQIIDSTWMNDVLTMGGTNVFAFIQDYWKPSRNPKGALDVELRHRMSWKSTSLR
uniref:Uncharacterized protein n=1 Tax=Physcomitrium patens TaxID=3218 RepID=A0A2K1L3W8_PHYPA|nr:hypothetical protein PHYPA_003521 [Physcomitrium patens]